MPAKQLSKRPKLRFVIRKYVIARSVAEALKHERKAPVHEVFVSAAQDDAKLADAIGFEYRVGGCVWLRINRMTTMKNSETTMTDATVVRMYSQVQASHLGGMLAPYG